MKNLILASDANILKVCTINYPINAICTTGVGVNYTCYTDTVFINVTAFYILFS